MRTDMMRIITDDGMVWEGMSEIIVGSKALGSKGDFEDIELAVLKRKGDANYLVRWARRINKDVGLLQVSLDEHGNEISSLAIGGTVKEVIFSSYDANETDAAIDKIKIRPIIVADLTEG